MEQGPVNPSRGFYLEVGLGIAGLVLSSTYIVVDPIVRENNAQSEAIRLAEIDQACGADPWRGSKMRPEENAPLSPLGNQPGASYGELPTTTELGHLKVLSDNTIGGSNELRLPTEYKSIFTNAFLDPYVACTSRDIVDKVVINSTTAGDGAQLDSAKKQTQLYFSLAEQPGKRIFATEGSVRAVLTHENTHGVLANWEQDPQNTADLTELTRIYRAEYNEVSEAFRAERGTEFIKHLQDLKREYQINGQREAIEAADYIIQQFGRPYGLNDLNFRSPVEAEQSWQTKPKTILEMLAIAPTSSGALGEKLLEIHKTVNVQGLKDAAKLQYEFFEGAYPDCDEDGTLGDLTPLGGHPSDSPDERLASTIASSQLNPVKVLAEIQKMPERRRSLVKQFYQQALQLYERNNPDLLRWMELPELTEKLQKM